MLELATFTYNSLGCVDRIQLFLKEALSDCTQCYYNNRVVFIDNVYGLAAIGLLSQFFTISMHTYIHTYIYMYVYVIMYITI